MRIKRSFEFETENFEVGDRIDIHLEDYGDFTATAQRVSEEGAIFLFDSIVLMRQLNELESENRGYAESDLRKWLENEFTNAFPEGIRAKIKQITIPTFGQIFGNSPYHSNFEPDNDEQFPAMRECKNRLRLYMDHMNCYWLQNSVKNRGDEYCALVTNDGCGGYGSAKSRFGVLPILIF